MILEFEAKKVTYNEALGGDIIQITFDKEKSNDSTDNPSIYLTISVQYEFPPFKPSVEWFDGIEYDGGIDIKNYKLNNNNLLLNLKNDMSFNISFKTDEIKFKKIASFFLNNCN